MDVLAIHEGLSFFGATWDSVFDELSELSSSENLRDFLRMGETDAESLNVSIEEIIVVAEAGATPLNPMCEKATKLFEEYLSSKKHRLAPVRLIARNLLSRLSEHGDRVAALVFFALSNATDPAAVRFSLPTTWRMLYSILNPNTTAPDAVTAVQARERLTVATHFCSTALRAHRSYVNQSLLRRMSLNLTRFACCMSIQCVVADRGPEFEAPFRFFAVLDAPDYDTYECCVLFLTGAIFESLRSLYLLLDSIPSEHPEAHPDAVTDGDGVLDAVLHEFRQLHRLCDSVAQRAGLPPKDADATSNSLSLLALLLFDQLVSLLLVHTGWTSSRAPSLWSALYKDSIQSVENWALFLLSANIVDC